MNEKIQAFLKAIKEQDHETVRALFSEAVEEAKNQPDKVVLETGKPAKFYKKSKRVELSPDGTWQPSKKSK